MIAAPPRPGGGSVLTECNYNNTMTIRARSDVTTGVSVVFVARGSMVHRTERSREVTQSPSRAGAGEYRAFQRTQLCINTFLRIHEEC